MGQAAPRHAPVCRGVEAPLDLCGCICPLLSPQPGGWGQGGEGQALPPRAPPSQGQSWDCRPKVDYYSVLEKRKNEFHFDFGRPLCLSAGFRAPVVIAFPGFYWFTRFPYSSLGRSRRRSGL